MISHGSRFLLTAVKDRNWLAHSYFWDRAGHFLTSDGCLFMAQELQEQIDFLSDFERQLDVVLEEWVQQNGVRSKLSSDA